MSITPAPQKMISLPEVFLKMSHPYLLATEDPRAFWLEHSELHRQNRGLEMIASENTPHPAAIEAAASVLSNKYAEGIIRHRYYGGCEYFDEAEELAVRRLKTLFGADYANVQPHAGSQANQAVYAAVLKPGDKIMSMKLEHGGHLSHGHGVTLTGEFYEVVSYGITSEGLIDYGQVRDIAMKERPKLIVAGGSAYPRTIDWKTFRDIADEVGAYLMADIAHPAGLIAAGLYPSPIKYADFTTTTTHKTLRGNRGGAIMSGERYDRKIMSKAGKMDELYKSLNSGVFPRLQGGPLGNMILAKAVAFKLALNNDETAVSPEFVDYQTRVLKNARVLSDYFQAKGYRLIGGGTDSHLLLLETPEGLSGLTVQKATELIGITINKNAVPDDLRPPTLASGVRIGTPAITTRRIGGDNILTIAECLDDLLSNTSENAADPKNPIPVVNPAVVANRKQIIEELCRTYPLYPEWQQMNEFVISHLGLQRPA